MFHVDDVKRTYEKSTVTFRPVPFSDGKEIPPYMIVPLPRTVSPS